ncbi:NAD-dependent epimerase/dehydratase family protein [Parasphingopyxis algicola]|uniref:NAD-dependent epimerase/dehydratase family protein n=1 Tax=Parasphingopyxis algicola TaxID=2026624 RepID=UPI00159FEDDB|nr:NAD-dependent epimerase/dehydratase family protein [Parasphingopyxis algicola]QLC25966.1 NAD-dependent epimerase/dehydratase family protein [Parasphingopyxis algicola]
MTGKCTVTGGGGFIGAYLVRRLVHDGWDVTVVDNMVRGDASRFADVADSVRLHSCDVRDGEAVAEAIRGNDVVFHLAAINGTENFYKRPELVLDVGLRGALAVVEACRDTGVPDLVVASSAEVYQTPATVPTDENVALMLPDSLNPRYSYGGSKIVSELIAFNYAQDHFRKVQVFRPHNVYGPDMGWKHVVPQFILRALACEERGSRTFSIQGDGSETRAFAYVEDVVGGILTMYARGDHRQVYHIGNDEEVSIRRLVELTGETIGIALDIEPGPEAAGGTPRRCPDISKMRAIGYDPQIALAEGLARTTDWYRDNRNIAPANELM